MSLGNLVYALSKLDKNQQREDMQTLRALLASDSTGQLAPLAYFLRESSPQPGEQASDRGKPAAGARRSEVNEESSRRFIKLLLRAARAEEGISRQEQAFLQALWRKIPRN
ncbi:TerB family tellurite resistance protein [Nibrella saemangeumensis]